MTPQARVQAAIEILDLIIAAARDNGAPADRIIADWFRTRRFAGSERPPRGARTGLPRHPPCGEVPAQRACGDAAAAKDDPALAALFDGSAHAPAPIEASERYARPGARACLARKAAGFGIAKQTGTCSAARRSISASMRSRPNAAQSICRLLASPLPPSMACACRSAPRSSNGMPGRAVWSKCRTQLRSWFARRWPHSPARR